MGVHDFWPLVEGDQPFRPADFKGKKVAVDFPCWLTAIHAVNRANGNAHVKQHLIDVFERICRLLDYSIEPVFVFEGKTSVFKAATRRERAINVHSQKSKQRYQDYKDKQAVSAAITSALRESRPKRARTVDPVADMLGGLDEALDDFRKTIGTVALPDKTVTQLREVQRMARHRKDVLVAQNDPEEFSKAQLAVQLTTIRAKKAIIAAKPAAPAVESTVSTDPPRPPTPDMLSMFDDEPSEVGSPRPGSPGSPRSPAPTVPDVPDFMQDFQSPPRVPLPRPTLGPGVGNGPAPNRPWQPAPSLGWSTKSRDRVLTEEEDECVELIHRLGCRVVIADTEAEIEAVRLYQTGIVSAVITSDSDAVVMGAAIVRVGTGRFYPCAVELAGYGPLDSRVGTFIAVILGNDYYPGVTEIGRVGAVALAEHVRSTLNRPGDPAGTVIAALAAAQHAVESGDVKVRKREAVVFPAPFPPGDVVRFMLAPTPPGRLIPAGKRARTVDSLVGYFSRVMGWGPQRAAVVIDRHAVTLKRQLATTDSIFFI